MSSSSTRAAVCVYECVYEWECGFALTSPSLPPEPSLLPLRHPPPARVWAPPPPPTLKRGVRTTAPALPNSKAVSSWGSTLCRQKSSGNESRLLLSSWKNFCFSAGSLIWGNKDRIQVGHQPSHAIPQLRARTGGRPPTLPERQLKRVAAGAQRGCLQIPRDLG